MSSSIGTSADRNQTDTRADERGRIIGSLVAIFIIADVFVFLRLLSRKLARAGYWVRMHNERTQRWSLRS